MAIKFHHTSKEFHLYNEKISYVIKVLKNGQLGHVYYGKKLTDKESFEYPEVFSTNNNCSNYEVPIPCPLYF